MLDICLSKGVVRYCDTGTAFAAIVQRAGNILKFVFCAKMIKYFKLHTGKAAWVMETKSHKVVLTCFHSWKRPNKSVYRIAITRLLLRCYKLEVRLGLAVLRRSTLYVCNNLLQYQWTKFTSTCNLRKQPTFGFPVKLCPRNKHRDSILMTCHYPDLGRASDWVNQISRVRCSRWLVPSACKLAFNKNPRLNPTLLSLACSPLFSDPIIS